MTSPPHDDSSQCALRPVRHRHGGPTGGRLPDGSPAGLTFWLHFPYQGFRWGYRCPRRALTRRRARSVHGRYARLPHGAAPTSCRPGHGARGEGWRTNPPLSGERADGGLRTGRVPDAGEATPAHAPVSPPGSRAGRGGTASTRPDDTAPGARAEAADTNAVSPASGAGADPNHRRPGRHPLRQSSRLPRVRSGAKAGFGMRGDRHGSRAERRFPA